MPCGAAEGVRFLPPGYGTGFVTLGIHALGDFDGDGVDDLLIRTTDPTIGEVPTDEVRLLLGVRGGLPEVVDAGDLPATPLARYRFGSGGDIIDDGYDDVVMSGAETFGVFGGADGLPATIDRASLDGTRGFSLFESGGSFPLYTN